MKYQGETKVSSRVRMYDKNWNVKISEKKLLDDIKPNDNKISYSQKEEGEFSTIIKLNAEEFQLKENKPDKKITKTDKGLYRYFFPLVGGDDSGENSEKSD